MKDSFLNVQRWLTELKQYAEPDCVIMLVGNKLDLVLSNRNKRQVSYEEGKSYANQNKLYFIETSVYSDYKVTEAFENLLEGINNLNKMCMKKRIKKE